jgi:hypothetical protein
VATPVGQPVQFRVDHLGAVPPTAPITWRVVNGPGTIDQTGRYVSNADGYATVEARRAAQLPFPEFRSRAAVVVGNPPPGAPVITAVTGRPLGVELRWEPPPLAPGQTVTRYAVETDPPTRTTFVPGTQTRAFVSALTPDQPYLVRVHAIAGTRVGTPSQWAGPVTPSEAIGRIGSTTNILSDGTGDAGTHGSALSGNGRYLFFVVENRSDLAPPEIHDSDGTTDYLLRMDLRTGEIVVASRGPDGRTPVSIRDTATVFDAGPSTIAVTPDGTKVAFVHWDSPRAAVLMHDLAAGRTRVVYDTTVDTELGNLSISDDGSVVIFRDAFHEDDVGTHLYRRVGDGPIQRVDNCLFGTGCDSWGVGAEMANDMSGDGTKIVYQEDDGDKHHILLYDATTGSTTDLTPGPGGGYTHPVISPDGTTWAAKYHDALGNRGVLRKRFGTGPPGPGDAVAVTSVGIGGHPAALSRDGSTLAYTFQSELGVAHETGFVFRGGGSEPLPHPAGNTWLDWNLDLSDNGTIITWQRGDCAGLSCRPQPGVFPMRLG